MSTKTRHRARHRSSGGHPSTGQTPAARRPGPSAAPPSPPRAHADAARAVTARPLHAHAARRQRIEQRRRMGLLLKIGGVVVGAIIVLGIIYAANSRGAAAVKNGQAGQYRFDVASPATGAVAPDFNLPSTTGRAVRLSDLRGKTVLLYFQEGIGCEGCWTQLKDIASDLGPFQRLGITDVLTITTNPLDALKQKVADEQIGLPVLSDQSFAVSRAYNATRYGMMAGSADGHTFILVGPDGRIRWRADYGGPPDYTMYVPISNLIADIKAGIHDS